MLYIFYRYDSQYCHWAPVKEWRNILNVCSIYKTDALSFYHASESFTWTGVDHAVWLVSLRRLIYCDSLLVAYLLSYIATITLGVFGLKVYNPFFFLSVRLFAMIVPVQWSDDWIDFLIRIVVIDYWKLNLFPRKERYDLLNTINEYVHKNRRTFSYYLYM